MEVTSVPQLIEHIHHQLEYTPFNIRWVPSSARCACVGVEPKGQGVLEVLELDNGKCKQKTKVSTPKGLKCLTMNISSSLDRSVATAGFGGNLCIFPIDQLPSRISEFRYKDATSWMVEKAHDSVINAIDGISSPGAPEIVTGDQIGVVKVWDPRTSKAVLEFVPEKKEKGVSMTLSSGRDCWTVAFGNAFNESERCVAAGYDNGDVKLFDMRTGTMRWETNLSNGVCGLQFDRKDIEMNKLVAATLESRLVTFDMRTPDVDAKSSERFAFVTKKAHKSTIWGVQHLPQNREIFASFGGNGGLNLYKYHYPGQRSKRSFEGRVRGVAGKLELLNSKIFTTQPIVSLDFHDQKEGLACMASMDQSLRIVIVTKLNLF